MKSHTKKLLPYFLPLGMAVITTVVFQNCGSVNSSHESSLSSVSVSTTSEESLKIRQERCASCHDGASAQAEPSEILDDTYLIANHWVIPGDPDSSPLYASLLANMPLTGPPLTDDEMKVMAKWIRDLATLGVKPALLMIADGSVYNFGSLQTGTTSSHAFNVVNQGQVNAEGIAGMGLSAPFTYKGGAYPGAGGTCGTTLAPAETCTIIVTYAPANAASHADTIELEYHNGMATKQATLGLTGVGTGIALASLSFVQAPSHDFGVVILGGSAKTATFSLKNTGAASATSLAGAALNNGFAYRGGSYPGTGGTCSTTLAKNATCTIVVTFLPTATGAKSSALTVNYKSGGGNASASLGLSGTGAGGGAAIYYSSVRAILDASDCNRCHSADWGTTYSALKAFKKSPNTTPAITPSSAASRFIVRISGSSGGPQMGIGGASGYGSLSTANRQTIINWIVAGAPDDPVTVTPALLAISESPTFAFGSVTTGASKDQTFTVSNTGGRTASAMAGAGLAAPFTFKGGSYPGTGGTCATSLAKAANCTVVVNFKPTGAGSFSDSLQVTYNDGTVNKTASRALTGTGAGMALASLTLSDGPTYDFGAVKVKTSVQKTFTVKNVGAAATKSLSTAALANGFAIATGGTCKTTLAAGATCKINVAFKPIVNGAKASTVTLNYNNGASAQSVSIAVKGRGTGATTSTTVYFSDIASILDNKCASCHKYNEFGTFNNLKAFFRAPNTTSALAGGLNSRFVKRVLGDMGAQGGLTQAEIDLILEWVADGAPNDPAGKVTQQFRPLLGDRYYITSILHNAFGTDKRVTNQTVLLSRRVDLFGTACHMQDATYTASYSRMKTLPFNDNCFSGASAETRLNPALVRSSSTVAESVRMSACLNIANNIANTKSALQAAGLKANADFTVANVTEAYARFYRGRTPASTAVTALQDVGIAATTNNKVVAATSSTKKLEGWRFIFLSLCLSSGWQAP